MSGGRLDTLTNQVQMRLETLDNLGNDWPQMSTDQKRQAIARSKREFTTIQNNINEMERLIQIMPAREREFFATDLENCREQQQQKTEQFKALGVELEEIIRREEEAKASGFDEEMLRADGEKAEGALANLQFANRLGQDTINTQNHITSTLADDKARLNNVSNNLDDIDNEADKGLKRGARMLARAICQGVGAWIMVILFAAFAAGGWYYCGHKKEWW